MSASGFGVREQSRTQRMVSDLACRLGQRWRYRSEQQASGSGDQAFRPDGTMKGDSLTAFESVYASGTEST